MYLTRELLATQLVEIGNAFGGRDHSTVIHSIEKVHDAVTEDPKLKSRIGRLRGMLETFAPGSSSHVERSTSSQTRPG
jgi:chromosomal replication initiator protein